MKKKQKIIIKNMISLSDILADALDDRYKKLYDRYEELELSHNRKKSLLGMIHAFFHDFVDYYDAPVDLIDKVEYLHRRITLELYGLENYESLKGKK